MYYEYAKQTDVDHVEHPNLPDLILANYAYVWAENTYRTANTGPFSTHNPENTVVYDPREALRRA